MLPYCSKNNFTANNLGEEKNIKKDNTESVTDHSYCKKSYVNNDRGLASFSDIAPKDESPTNFLNFHTHEELYQENDYEEKLLLPDIFKLTKLDEPNLDTTVNFSPYPYINKTTTSCTVKRLLIENEPLLSSPEPKRIYLKQSIDNEELCTAPSLNFTEQIIKTKKTMKDIEPSVQNLPISEQPSPPERPAPNVMKKKVSLRPYHRNNLYHTEPTISVYRDAIKKIGIDGTGLFKNRVLEEIYVTRSSNFIKSSVSLYTTYAKVRKYVLEKIFTCLNDITATSDVLIRPGMSISDLIFSCTSNNIFFEKLREKCREIVENIQATPDKSLSYLIQSYISFYHNDNLNSIYKKSKFFVKKDRLIIKLKELIINTISDLPDSIVHEIKKFNKVQIVQGLFLDMHGVFVSKSLIRDINLLFNSNKNKFVNGGSDDNLNLFNRLLGKIGNLVRSSCIFQDGVFLPNKHTVEKLSKYILSDIYGVSSKFHKKLKLSYKNISKPHQLINHAKLSTNYKKVLTDIYVKEELPSPKSYLTSKPRRTSSETIDIKIEKFGLKPYHRKNLRSTEFTLSIYEYAIKKIDIDSNESFKNSILEEIGPYIANKGFTKSYINLSPTYLNVRKYVLDMISPHINNIIYTSDVLITLGMSVSDMKHNCMSNNIFFEKLQENCKKVVKDVLMTPDDVFSNIIQSSVNFGSYGSLNIVSKKNKFCSKVKTLIMETLLNLPNNIIDEIKNFEKGEIIRGLFSETHGVFVSKSLIRNINYLFNFNKNKLPNNNKLPDYNFDDNLYLLNNLLTKLVYLVKKSLILSEGELLFPNATTAESLSRYLLADVYGISAKFHRKLKLSEKNILNPLTLNEDISLEIKLIKEKANDDYENIESKTIEKPTLIPSKNSRWNPSFITSLNIYELAISMINIDKGDFENSLTNKIKNIPSIKKCINEKVIVNIDISATYGHIKNYILDLFYPFLKKIKKETKVEEKLQPGMTLDKLEYAYISNEVFFTKLRKFCIKLIDSIKNCTDGSITDMVQCYINLETEVPQRIAIKRNRKVKFHEDVEKLLTINISAIPDTIVNAIKLLPPHKLVGEYLSHFHDMYVDNESLTKIKPIFDFTHEKIINDPMLSRLIDEISVDMIDKFDYGKNTNKIINSHTICEGLSACNYIRKIVRDEFTNIRNNIGNYIMVMYNNKIEIADEKTRCRILEKLESDLIVMSIKTYREICTKAYKSKIRTKHIPCDSII